MTTTLLDALMRLYALLTNVSEENRLDNAKRIVKEELRRSFNKEYADEYYRRFLFYIDEYHRDTYSSVEDKVNKQSDHNFHQLDHIYKELNKELEQESKTWLFIQLFEFVRKEQSISKIGDSIIERLSKGMLIDKDDYELLREFILKGPEQVHDPSKVLVISGQPVDENSKFKQVYNERQLVKVWILYVQSTHTFIFRYEGDRNLYLNGHKVEQQDVYIFSVGSVIRTSRMEPIYYGKVAEMFVEHEDKGTIMFRARDIEYRFNDRQIGIHEFSFTGRSNQLIGIMGGSGSGKSTLLNVLNGNYKLYKGTIQINGLDIHANTEQLKGVIGYVPQDDLLIEELTVFENLYCNAKLCFSDFDKSEVVDIVERALKDFDLIEARDLVVGSPTNKVLSGGQRKRLNIALELIREPSVLFADEPTSGLSSMDSEKVMLLLKRQALKGKLVIINIHQPSSDVYKLIDKLLIIDKGGYIIYNGNIMDAIVYFKEQSNYVNPQESECSLCGNVKVEQPLRIIEQRIVDTNGRLIRERKIKPVEWYERYRENIEKFFPWKVQNAKDEKLPLPKNLYNIPGRFKQFLIYSYRDALAKFKDKQYMLINLLEAPILAIMISYFTKYIIRSGESAGEYHYSLNSNIPAYLFMLVIVALFLGLNLSAEEIIKDRRLLQREKFLNLSRSSYLNSKIMIQFGISAVQMLLLVWIGNTILEIKGLTFSYWLILFSVACFANIVGLNISSGMKTVVSIYILIPLIIVPQLLFSGIIVDFTKLHTFVAHSEYVPRIGDLMTSRWAYEALAVNQFENNEYEKQVFEYNREQSRSDYYTGILIPRLKKHNKLSTIQLSNNDTISATANRDIIFDAARRMGMDKYKPVTPYINALKKASKDISHSTESNIESLLDSISVKYKDHYADMVTKKDDKIKSLITKYGSKEKFMEFKNQYYNDKLSDFMLNRSEIQQFTLVDNSYIPIYDPIYRDGSSQFGRAHYFAANKHFMGMLIPTFIYNLIVMWLSTILLYFTLYTDLLRKSLYKFEKFKLRKAFTRNINRV